MERFNALALLFALAAAPALAVEGTTSVAPDGRLQFSGIDATPREKPTLVFGSTMRGATVEMARCDLKADFSPWFVGYATAVDELLRAASMSGEAPADTGQGASLRAAASRLEAIEAAAEKVRQFHAKMRINE
jgi:hypothetical protein